MAAKTAERGTTYIYKAAPMNSSDGSVYFEMVKKRYFETGKKKQKGTKKSKKMGSLDFEPKLRSFESSCKIVPASSEPQNGHRTLSKEVWVTDSAPSSSVVVDLASECGEPADQTLVDLVSEAGEEPGAGQALDGTLKEGDMGEALDETVSGEVEEVAARETVDHGVFAECLPATEAILLRVRDRIAIIGPFRFQVLVGEVEALGFGQKGGEFDPGRWTEARGTVLSGPVVLSVVASASKGHPGATLNNLQNRLKSLASEAARARVVDKHRLGHVYVLVQQSLDPSLQLWNSLNDPALAVFRAQPRGFPIGMRLSHPRRFAPLLSFYRPETLFPNFGQMKNFFRVQDLEEELARETAQLRQDLRPPQRTVLAAGPKNAGKSTLLRRLANGLLRRGVSVCWLEADVGQTEVGGPGTVTLARLDAPLLGPAPTNAAQMTVLKSFFYGDVTFGARLPALRAAFAEVRDAFAASFNQVLLVNSCGWVQGLGLRLLKDLGAALRPDHVLKLNCHKLALKLGQRETIETSMEHGYTNEQALRTAAPEIRAWKPREIRELATLARLRGLHSTPDLAELQSRAPLSVAWARLALWFHQPLPASQALAVLNGSYVALASLPAHLLPPPSDAPRVVDPEQCGALPEVRGFGVVRGVDLEGRRLLISTGLRRSELRKVSVLAVGSVALPNCLLFSASGASRAPFVLSAMPSQPGQEGFQFLEPMGNDGDGLRVRNGRLPGHQHRAALKRKREESRHRERSRSARAPPAKVPRR